MLPPLLCFGKGGASERDDEPLEPAARFLVDEIDDHAPGCLALRVHIGSRRQSNPKTVVRGMQLTPGHNHAGGELKIEKAQQRVLAVRPKVPDDRKARGHDWPRFADMICRNACRLPLQRGA